MTTVSAVTPLPTAPSRADPDNFADRADTFLAALVTFATELNVSIGQLNTVAGEVNTNATNAAASAAQAAATTGVTIWVSGTTYAIGDCRFSPSTYQTFRRKTAGAGTTDPASDSTNWKQISADLTNSPAITTPVVTGGTFSTPLLTGTQQTKVAMAANNIDCSAGDAFSKTISGSTTLTVSNVPASGRFYCFILDLTNGGSAAITWWSGMKWVGGVAPTLTSSGRDVLAFFTHDGGTTWTGLVLGRDVK